MALLANRVALVTGAGRGLGQGIAERLADEGAQIAVVDIDPETAAAAAAAIGNGAAAFTADVADLASVQDMAAGVVERFGRIDVLVNNAARDIIEPFLDSRPDAWDTVIGVNLYGVIHTCKTVLPTMVEQGYGRIVNIGSDAGRVGSSGEAVYSATKGGVIALTKTLAREMARHGITVNAVSPGPADAPLFAQLAEANPKLAAALEKTIPLRRLAAPADVAHAVALFAADAAGYITGQTLSVSGGLTMA